MMKRFLTWLRSKLFSRDAASAPVPRRTAPRIRQSPKPSRPKDRDAELVEVSTELGGRIEDGGPGKNVLIRNKYVREDSGTHETLKIIDDTFLEDEEERGIDPYNTGRFDRSKSWDLRTKK